MAKRNKNANDLTQDHELMSYAKRSIVAEVEKLQSMLNGPLKNVALPGSLGNLIGFTSEESPRRSAKAEKTGGRRQMSPAARKRLSEGMKKRWAARNEAKAQAAQAQTGTTEAAAPSTEGNGETQAAAPENKPRRGAAKRGGSKKGARRQAAASAQA